MQSDNPYTFALSASMTTTERYISQIDHNWFGIFQGDLDQVKVFPHETSSLTLTSLVVNALLMRLDF